MTRSELDDRTLEYNRQQLGFDDGENNRSSYKINGFVNLPKTDVIRTKFYLPKPLVIALKWLL